MTVLDSNIRIDGENNRRFKEHIASKLTELATADRDALLLVGRFIRSRFEEASEVDYSAAKGAVSVKAELVSQIDLIRKLIREFVDAMQDEIESSNHVRITDDGVSDSTVLGDRTTDAPVALPDVEVPVPDETGAVGLGLGLPFGACGSGDFGIGLGARPEARRTKFLSFKNVPLAYMGSKVGDTMKSWYKLHPLRLFGALLVQCSMQIASLLRDTVTFINSLAQFDAAATDATVEGDDTGNCCLACVSPLWCTCVGCTSLVDLGPPDLCAGADCCGETVGCCGNGDGSSQQGEVCDAVVQADTSAEIDEETREMEMV